LRGSKANVAGAKNLYAIRDVDKPRQISSGVFAQRFQLRLPDFPGRQYLYISTLSELESRLDARARPLPADICSLRKQGVYAT